MDSVQKPSDSECYHDRQNRWESTYELVSHWKVFRHVTLSSPEEFHRRFEETGQTLSQERSGREAVHGVLVCEAIGTAATPGLLCQSRVIVKMIVEKQMECRFARETEVLGENLPQRHFCPSQYPTWPDLGLNPGRRGGKPETNCLSYGAALHGVSTVL
jgi:hypothetical protein